MLTLPHLKIFAVFSSFPLIIGDDPRNRSTAVGIHHDDAADGAQYIKRIIHGEKISDRPGLLLFTAPYKLCEGGCKGNVNFGMVFPLFIGRKGAQAYKNMYHQDFERIHSESPNAPFAKKTTRAPFTLCPPIECPTLPTTVETSTSLETFTSVETTTGVSCPPINWTCPRHKSTTVQPINTTVFDTNTNIEEKELNDSMLEKGHTPSIDLNDLSM